MVSPVSAPQPAASGRAASNASLVRQRWPFSGWAGRQPVARSMPAPDSPTTRPCPPRLTRSMNTAMVMSASPARTGSISGVASIAVSPRSASRNSRCRGGRPVPASSSRTTSAPDSIAAALPRLRACRSTVPPARSAMTAVLSVDPSSTTTTRSTPASLPAAATVAGMRSASFFAGIITATSPVSGIERDLNAGPGVIKAVRADPAARGEPQQAPWPLIYGLRFRGRGPRPTSVSPSRAGPRWPGRRAR